MLKHTVARLCCAFLCVVALAPSAWAVRALSAEEAAALLKNPPAGLSVVDVRTPEEFAAGHLDTARNIDFFGPSFEKDLLPMDRKKPYLLYCRNGTRSEKAGEIMKTMGFTDVRHVTGGIGALEAAGAPVKK